MASHSEFNNTTTATEVAVAFGTQIKGKTSKYRDTYAPRISTNMAV